MEKYVKLFAPLMLVLAVAPSCMVHAQKKEATLAILENKEQAKGILNDLAGQKKVHDKTLVIYNNQFYRLSDFSLADTLSSYSLTMHIVKQPALIKSGLAKHIETVILLESKSSKDNQ